MEARRLEEADEEALKPLRRGCTLARPKARRPCSINWPMATMLSRPDNLLPLPNDPKNS
jgi:hypothetical protein